MAKISILSLNNPSFNVLYIQNLSEFSTHEINTVGPMYTFCLGHLNLIFQKVIIWAFYGLNLYSGNAFIWIWAQGPSLSK